MDSWHVSFGPCDPFNPQFGYQIRVEKNGRTVLFTGQHPVTGKDLTFESCLEVAGFYGEKRPEVPAQAEPVAIESPA